MKRGKDVLYLLIIIFTFLMTIIPSSFHIGLISLNGDVLLYLIIVYFIILFILDKKERNKFLSCYKSGFNDYLNVFMLLWSVIMCISIIYSRDKFIASIESMRLTSYVILFFILKYYINKEKAYKNILKSYMLSSMAVGIYGFYQNFIGKGFIQNSALGTQIRVYSFMENPNNLGMYFVFAFFPFIIMFIKSKEKKNKIWYLVLTIISLANIIFSGSRNALIGFTLGILVLIILMGIRYIFLFVFPAVIFFIPKVTSRVKDISDSTQNISRIIIWKLAGRMIKDHPLLGVGNGNYPKALADYTDITSKIDYNFGSLVHPHNAFLKAFSELGIFGLITFTGIIISSILTVYNFVKNRSSDFYKWFYTGIFVSLFPMVSMNMFDSFFTASKVIVYYFIMLGVCEGIRYRGYEG